MPQIIIRTLSNKLVPIDVEEGEILDLSFFVVPEEKRVFAVTIVIWVPDVVPDVITLDACKSMPVLNLKTAIETRTEIPWDLGRNWFTMA